MIGSCLRDNFYQQTWTSTNNSNNSMTARKYKLRAIHGSRNGNRTVKAARASLQVSYNSNNKTSIEKHSALSRFSKGRTFHDPHSPRRHDHEQRISQSNIGGETAQSRVSKVTKQLRSSAASANRSRAAQTPARNRPSNEPHGSRHVQ